MIFGIDTLGGAKYPDVVRKIAGPDVAIGGFDNTFGPFLPVAEKALAKGSPVVRIQMLWSDSHQFGVSDIPKISKIARQYEQLARKHIGQRLELSPFCEHNLNDPDRYLDIVQGEAPSCYAVNTPWKGAFSTRYKNEIHGTKKPPKGEYNFSYDGLDCFNSDAQSFKDMHERAKVFFWWFSQCNGRMTSADNTPRPQRKAWPDVKLCQSALYMNDDRGPAKLPRNWLWKSHAEQKKPEGDPRANKPVLITPLKVDRFQLVNSSGKVVLTLPYYGSFVDGRHRYYSSKYGMELGPNLALRAKGKDWGVVNAGFRFGGFRD